jgi:hypothetical protein
MFEGLIYIQYNKTLYPHHRCPDRRRCYCGGCWFVHGSLFLCSDCSSIIRSTLCGGLVQPTLPPCRGFSSIWPAAVLVCLARKSRFGLLCVVAGGCWYVDVSVLAVSPFTTPYGADLHSTPFFAILVSSSCAESLGSVCVGWVCCCFCYIPVKVVL